MNTPNKHFFRYGLLLLNMGGPCSEKEIGEYLFRLFSDPYIIGLPGPLRKPLARLIRTLRRKKAASRYALIGGKSPLDLETRKQAEELEKILGFPVTYAMRYTEPSVEKAARELEEKGIQRLVVFPLYPQFSHVTTTSAVEEFKKRNRFRFSYRVVESHYDFPPYIDSLSHLLHLGLDQIDPDRSASVLFVAHSIPMKRVKSGDPYVEQVKKTVSLVTRRRRLPCPFSIAYQSRVGPVKWQGPSLEEELHRLRKEKIEQLVVHPVSFVSENLETLYDLDIAFERACKEAGIKKYIRVPAPGISPLYIGAAASRVKEEIQNWEVSNV